MNTRFHHSPDSELEYWERLQTSEETREAVRRRLAKHRYRATKLRAHDVQQYRRG